MTAFPLPLPRAGLLTKRLKELGGHGLRRIADLARRLATGSRLDAGEVSEELARVFAEGPAGVVQREDAGAALDERHAAPRLEVRQAPADSRARDGLIGIAIPRLTGGGGNRSA